MHDQTLTNKRSALSPQPLPNKHLQTLTSKHSQKILDMIEQFLVCASFHGTHAALSQERCCKNSKVQPQLFKQVEMEESKEQEDEMDSSRNILIESPKPSKSPGEEQREQKSLMIKNESQQMSKEPRILSKQIKQFFRQKLSFSEILEELSKCCPNWKSDDKSEEQTEQKDEDNPKLLYFFDVFSAPISRIELPAYNTFRVEQERAITLIVVNQRQHQCCLVDDRHRITLYDTLNSQKQIETANECKEELTVAKWDIDENVLLLGTKSGNLIMIRASNLKNIDSLKVHQRQITSIIQNERCIYTSSKDHTLCKINLKTQELEHRIRCCDFSCMAKLPGREHIHFIFGLHNQKQIIMVDQLLQFQSTILMAESHSSITSFDALPQRNTLLLSVSKKSPEIHELNPFTSQSVRRVTILTDNYRQISSVQYSEDVIAVSFQSNKIKYYSLRSWKLLHTHEGEKNLKIDGLEAMDKHKIIIVKHEKGFSLYSTEMKEHVFLKFLPEKPRLRQTNIHFLSMLRSLGAAV